MTEHMTHQERIKATLTGKEVDRMPASMWRHFFGHENSAESLADAMLGFQRRYDWDFVKINPRASYHAEGWGLKMRYDGDQPPVVSSTPIAMPVDWSKVEVLKPDEGVLGEQLKAIELIADGLQGSAPFLMTVFSPISIAAKLAPSKQSFISHLREHTDTVTSALNAITETFIRFSLACLERGVSGLFMATTDWASSEWISEEEYRQLARPYDLKLLNSLPPTEFGILHVCGPHNFLRLVSDYPVDAFNWDTRATGNLSLAQGQALLKGKTVVGGLSQGNLMAASTPEQITGEVIGLRVALGSRRWILAPGCTFSPETPEANITAVRQAVEKGL
jgi:uroporphyrinogen decarboxylase